MVEASYVQKTDSESSLDFSLLLFSITVYSLQPHYPKCDFLSTFQEGQSSQSRIATLPPLPPPPHLTQAKKLAGDLGRLFAFLLQHFKALRVGE